MLFRSQYDKESKRIMALCKPFWLSAFVTSICSVLTASLIGHSLGIDALTIFYVVEVPTSFTYTVISAILETISTLCGQSIGVGSYKLTGQYCQISVILFTLLYIPHAVFWTFMLEPTLRWISPDLDDAVINEGYHYFLVSIVLHYIESLSMVVHS